jgi:hypothetical protein
LSSLPARRVSAHRRKIFVKLVGQNCPRAGSRTQRQFGFGREQRCSRASAFSEEELKHAGAPEAHNSCPRAEAEISRYVDCYIGRLTPMCACQPLPFHLRRRKFSTIWPDIRRHKTPSTVSFIGGCSTPAFESGPRKLQRPSRNSSNKVFSKKSDLRTAKYFTAPPRTISRRFSNGHHETLLLTQVCNL